MELLYHLFTPLGDLKESPSLGESSHMVFSPMVGYSSLTILHFQNNSLKPSRIKFVCISPEVYIQSREKYKTMFCY